MPRAITRPSMDADVLAEVERRTQEIIDGQVGVIGPPAGAVRLSDNEALDWFDWIDPKVTPDMLAGLDDEQATFLKHPRRFQLAQSLGDDPEEQVAAMDRYRRLSDERKLKQAPVQTPMGMPEQTTMTPGPLQAGPYQMPPPLPVGDAWETGGV